MATNQDNPFARRSRVARTPPPKDKSKSITSMEEKRTASAGFTQFNKALLVPTPKTTLNLMHEPMSDVTNQQSSFVTQTADGEYITNLQSQLQQAIAEINQLRHQVNALQEQNQRLSQSQKASITKEFYSPTNSDEEEEIVRRETDWLLTKNSRNKKRKATESPEKAANNPENQVRNIPKTIKPPPVILSKVDDYNTIKNKLNEGKIDYKANMLNRKQVKINVSSTEDYRKITALANETEVEWHTYENKAIRPIRVMARNLIPSVDCDEITKELKERNFKVKEVIQKLKKNTVNNKVDYSRLPLYVLVFEASEDIKKIYNIQYINNFKVKIEAIRNSKLIAQCKRCQRYGHTKRFCNRAPACVKCAGNHLTASCTKARDTPAKCINCKEMHPANYRGCEIAKELQKRRDNATKAKTTSSQQRQFN